MVGLIIFGGITLFIAVLLTLSACVTFDYKDEINIKITYLFLTLYPRKKRINKPGKIKVKRNKSDLKQTNTDLKCNKNNKNSKNNGGEKITREIKQGINSNNIIEKMDFKFIKLLIESFAHPFGRLFKKIRFNEIYIVSKVGGEDAAQVAVNYGLQSIALNSLLNYLKNTATINIEKISLEADFNNTESFLVMRSKIKIRLGTLLLYLIIFFKRFLKNNIQKTENNLVQNKSRQINISGKK